MRVAVVRDMKVKEVMSTELFTVGYDKKVVVASEVMNWARVRHIPIVDAEDKLVGLITHRDLLRASFTHRNRHHESAAERQTAWELPLAQVMKTNVRTINKEASVGAAARLMRKFKFGCLPVVDDKDRLVGIVTEADLLDVVSKAYPD